MRHRIYLRSRYRVLLSYIGQLLVLIGIFHLAPLLLIPAYPAEAEWAGGFVLAGLPLIVAGLLAWKLFSPQEALSLTVQEGSVIVITVWLVAIAAAAVPFITISGLSLPQAVFEATSGWTTTGLTVVDVETAPAVILFFRSFIQLAGGAGFAIIALSAVAGSFGTGLVAAEGRTDQLAPHVRHSAGIVLRIYGAYIVFGVLALRLAGMGWFDAANHAFTALATGGFSTRTESIAYWDSGLIEAIICVLMLLGALNFLTAYTFLRRKFNAVRRNGEIRLAAVLILVSALLLLVVVTWQLYEPDKALRTAVFEVISALTGTGFTIAGDLHHWGDFSWLLLIVLMSVGGGTGSTSGGLKQMRVYIMYKAVSWEIKRAFMPRHMVNEPAIWQGDRRELLSDRQVRKTAAFTGMYLGVLLAGSALMMAYGYPLKDSLFEFASTLGTVGLSVGVTSPDMPPALLVAQSIGMLLGRLEIFVVIVGSLKLFADLRTMLGLRFRPAAT